MMYSISLPWKSFNINLQEVDTLLKSQFASYKGNCAHSSIDFYFEEDPSIVPTTPIMQDQIVVSQEQALDPITNEPMFDENLNPIMVEVSNTIQVEVQQPTGPSIKQQVEAYWETLVDTSPEATSYKSQEQIKQEANTSKQALLSSARTKLEVLGLLTQEINAIMGVQ